MAAIRVRTERAVVFLSVVIIGRGFVRRNYVQSESYLPEVGRS
jgi:hypothetical protein